VLERDRYVLFANCGLPYHIGGAIPGRGSLLLQTPESPETCASLILQVNSPRWAGVRFALCSGKALAADPAEIAICFRPLARYLPGQWPSVEPNVLTVGLTEPYVRSRAHRRDPPARGAVGLRKGRSRDRQGKRGSKRGRW
jgi:hypothetical protein